MEAYTLRHIKAEQERGYRFENGPITIGPVSLFTIGCGIWHAKAEMTGSRGALGVLSGDPDLTTFICEQIAPEDATPKQYRFTITLEIVTCDADITPADLGHRVEEVLTDGLENVSVVAGSCDRKEN